MIPKFISVSPDVVVATPEMMAVIKETLPYWKQLYNSDSSAWQSAACKIAEILQKAKASGAFPSHHADDIGDKLLEVVEEKLNGTITCHGPAVEFFLCLGATPNAGD